MASNQLKLIIDMVVAIIFINYCLDKQIITLLQTYLAMFI